MHFWWYEDCIYTGKGLWEWHHSIGNPKHCMPNMESFYHVTHQYSTVCSLTLGKPFENDIIWSEIPAACAIYGVYLSPHSSIFNSSVLIGWRWLPRDFGRVRECARDTTWPIGCHPFEKLHCQQNAHCCYRIRMTYFISDNDEYMLFSKMFA